MAVRKKEEAKSLDPSKVENKGGVISGISQMKNLLLNSYTGADKVKCLTALADSVRGGDTVDLDASNKKGVALGAAMAVKALEDAGASNATLNKADDFAITLGVKPVAGDAELEEGSDEQTTTDPAHGLTVKQLKAALDEAGIEYPKSANKDVLQEFLRGV